VSKISKIAEVSRSNLYVHHRPLLVELGLIRDPATATNKDAIPLDGDRDESTLASVKRKYKAALLLCVEQQAVISRLQREIADFERDKAEKRRPPKGRAE
jgi:hypothetical protein